MQHADRPGWDLARYYSLADQALYAAKQNGRDAVWVARADQERDPKPTPSDIARSPASCAATPAL